MKKIITIILFSVISFSYFGQAVNGTSLNINGSSDLHGGFVVHNGEFRMYKNGVHGIKMAYADNFKHVFFDFNNKIYFRNMANGSISPLLLQSNGSVIINAQTDWTNLGLYNTQGFKLAVNGGILCEEIKVILDVPAYDIVFEPTYKLMPLLEVEKFITKYKHLPEIPSAKEFKKNGYKLGEMDGWLLKKTEELTLHMIDMKKEVEEMKKSLKILKKENIELKNKIQTNVFKDSNEKVIYCKKLDIRCLILGTDIEGKHIIKNNREYQNLLNFTVSFTSDCLNYQLPIVDFNKNSIVSYVTSVGGCEIPDFTYKITKVNNEYKVIVNIKKKGNCKRNNAVSFWCLIPKIKEGENIRFEINKTVK